MLAAGGVLYGWARLRGEAGLSGAEWRWAAVTGWSPSARRGVDGEFLTLEPADDAELAESELEENGDGYERSSAMPMADRLSGHLLLIHSAMDENVHAQHTFQLLTALTQAGSAGRTWIEAGRDVRFDTIEARQRSGFHASDDINHLEAQTAQAGTVLVGQLATMAFGVEFRSIGIRLGSVNAFDMSFAWARIITFGVALAGILALWLFLTRTYMGALSFELVHDEG